MSDFVLLRRFDPAGLRDAAEGWRRLSAAAEDANSQHRHRVNGPLRGHWQGRDADSAFSTMESTEQKLEIVRVEAASAALVLDTVAERMDQARTNLLNALQRADEWNLPVAGDGTVGLPPQTAADRHDPDAQADRQNQGVLREQVQDRINTALTAAREASDQGTRALGRLDASILTQPRVFGAAGESAKDAQDVAKDLGLTEYIPENKDPKQAAKWWKSLTPDQQQSYIALHPEEIGRLDGLPSTVRDQANRLVLEQQLDALKAGDARGSGMTAEEYNQRETNLRVLKDRLDQRDGSDEQHQLFLLGLDPHGDGRAIVSTGNPDTADHTAVLVPGTGTTLQEVPGQIDRIGRLQDSAENAAGPGQKVAVVSWLGYDAPEVDTSVMTTGRAEDGAAGMRQFTDGMRTVQGDHRSHLTVIGHSYGTTAVGAAAAGGQGLQADDIVAIASPGMTTGNAADLHVDPDHFWAGTASDDNISLVTGLTLGPDPTLGSFGGKTIGIDTSGHSGYWDPHSESLANQGKIIAGRTPSTVDNHRGAPPRHRARPLTPERRPEKRPAPMHRTSTHTRRRALAAATALSVSLLLGGCVTSPDPNEPLPVMAKSDAEAWARHMTEYMAQTADITLTPDSAKPYFSNCEGKNGEVADDGRYTLAYHAASTVPVAQHPDAVRKIKAALEKEGFAITGYRETVNDQPDALLYAKHNEGRYFIDVSTGGGTDRLTFTVNTRCLMPPSTSSPTKS
ncbi:alpha/beta hydrolase [Kitasatospora griseola]|uniref:alpha/beta hydrolase n=1 Tax=Kitasatospora griseola TaxID=2064 RepID=UPI00381BD4DB